MIEIDGLRQGYPGGPAVLDGISLTIPPGQFVILAGANGCGKTTFLRHLNGLIKPPAGTVRVAGVDVHRNPLRARQLVGMVFQDPDTQIVGETVYDDVAFGPQNLGLPDPEVRRRVDAALAAVGLASLSGQRPHRLSGGEKRRVAIAGILAMESPVYVFDEPFSNLDFHGVRQVLRQIASLKTDGRTIILTTHDLEKVIGMADRLIILHQGKVVRDGAPLAAVRDSEIFGVREPDTCRMGLMPSPWLN